MGRLRVDFSRLHEAVKRMGAAEIAFRVDVNRRPLAPIDFKLREGLEISLDEISYEGGLLSYEGRQILLYIKDHTFGVRKALVDGQGGRRFHVADCKTLQDMRAKNRFDRYYVTNDLGGEFEITGVDSDTRRQVTGKARLRVCQNCLKKLNYRGYTSVANPKKTIWETFKIDEFFQRYSSCFKYLPQHREDDNAQYTDDWGLVAGRLKAERGFRCEQCGVRLSDHKNLLHVHHVSGHKSDNSPSNLRVLCIDCHRKQASHEHLFVSHQQMQLINRLRRAQDVGSKGGWDEVVVLADPAVEGVILLCRHHRTLVPEVGYELLDREGKVVAEVELAWPDQRVAVVLSGDEKGPVERLDWKAREMIEVLDAPERFLALFRR